MDNFISAYDLDYLQELVNKCGDILKRERLSRSRSISYSDTSLLGKKYESNSVPGKYYNFIYFDKHVSIVCDRNYISFSHKKVKMGKLYYHLIISGFVPNFDIYHTSIDKLDIHKDLVYGNFETLDEALSYFKVAVSQCMNYEKPFCKHWCDNKCEFFEF